MTDLEKTKKEIRKDIRDVFMKYKRENFWNSKGHYEYHKNSFRMAFSMKLHDRMFWNNYIAVSYKDGTTIKLDYSISSFLPAEEFYDLGDKVCDIIKEMNEASKLWRSFYMMKYGVL